MNMPLDHDVSAPAPPAVGARRALNRVVGGVMRILPRYWRNRLGWWTWNDVLDPKGYYFYTLSKGTFADQQPVATLLRRGFAPPAKGDLWLRCFDGLHNTWNIENHWDCVSFHELRAWATVWSQRPSGQANLDMALVGVVGAGLVGSCRMLLDHGANPLASPYHGGCVMDKLWSGRVSWDKQLPMWKDLTSQHPALASTSSWWKWCRRNRSVGILSAEELTQWQYSGLPMPSPAAATRFACQLVDDVDLSSFRSRMRANQWALAWWKKSGLLPLSGHTELLKTWLSTARPGANDYYQEAMLRWAELLVSQPLPPRPKRGPELVNSKGFKTSQPALPWSHWAMSGPFFENIPESVRAILFSEPDAWTARNGWDETIHQVIERRIHETRSQSRDEGLAKLRAWSRRATLAHLVEDRPAPAPGPARARRM